jgi:hypothetical protein
MTPEELAEQTGLSLEEAEMVLERRRILDMAQSVEELAHNGSPEGSRLLRAIDALMRAQRRVGVAPVRLEGEEILKGELPVQVAHIPGGPRSYPRPGDAPTVGRVVDNSEDYKQ